MIETQEKIQQKAKLARISELEEKLVKLEEKYNNLEIALMDEDFLGLFYEDFEIADTGDYETTWMVKGYRYGLEQEIITGYGKTPVDALLDSQKEINDPSKWDYIPDDY